jgi:anti-sigma factor RsiW
VRHPDEAALHELIDGSLAPVDARRVEAHLAACEACRARLAEARALVQETAGLIAALDAPAAGASPTAAHPPRHRRRAFIGWAASIAAAVGLGFAWHAPAGRSGTAAASARNEASTTTTVADAPAKAAPSPAPKPLAESALARRPDASTNNQVESLADRPGDGPRPVPARAAEAASQPPEVLRRHQPAAVALEAASLPAGNSDPHSITLDEAVQRLGGSIRLIDGLEPVSVSRVPGSMVDGADPRREAVLVRYLDPTLGAIQLAQQRILTADSLDASAPPTAGATAPLAIRSTAAPTRDALATVSWKDGHGFQMTLTAAVPAESLAALRARVR